MEDAMKYGFALYNYVDTKCAGMTWGNEAYSKPVMGGGGQMCNTGCRPYDYSKAFSGSTACNTHTTTRKGCSDAAATNPTGKYGFYGYDANSQCCIFLKVADISNVMAMKQFDADKVSCGVDNHPYSWWQETATHPPQR
jgi:hypothetical protein